MTASPQLSPIHLRSPIQQALPYAAVPAQSGAPSGWGGNYAADGTNAWATA